MKQESKNSSILPLIIIGAVLLAAVGGAYILYSNSQSAANANRAAANSGTTNSQRSPATAPVGANPPNMLGAPNASVTVEEFADFQCGACASVHPVLKEVQSIYGNRIRFIFRSYPLAIPAHDKAYEAAVAAEAAGMQDRSKYWAMQGQLFENQQAWTANPNYRTIWEGYAQQIGLDVERFKADMAGRDAKSRVDADMARGRGLSVDSTPTLLVNGKNVPLQQITTANLRQMIDAEIQSAAKNPPAGNTAAAPANAANSAANSK